MRIRNLLIATLISTSLSLFFSSAASAAQTRDLPVGVQAYAITDDGGQLVTLNVKTGVMELVDKVTPIDHSISNNGSGSAYIPSTGYVYWADKSNNLRKTNVSSGTSSLVHSLTISGSVVPKMQNPVLATAPNESVWVFYILNQSPYEAFVGQLDIVTGNIQSPQKINGDYITQIFRYNNGIYSFSYNSIDSTWYIISGAYWNKNPLWSIDLTGLVSDSKTVGTTSDENGLVFDKNGIMWTLSRGNELMSQTIAGYSLIGDLESTTTTYQAWSMFLVESSPTVISSPAVISSPVASQEQIDAEARARREVAIRKSRNEATLTVSQGGVLTLQALIDADLTGATSNNIGAINAEISNIPQGTEKNFSTIEKVVLKYMTVDKISTGRFYSSDLAAIGLIDPDSKQKTSARVALKRLPVDQIDTYAKIETIIKAVEKKAADRKARLASIKLRISAMSVR